MMTNIMNRNGVCDKIKKPLRPHIAYEQNPVTAMELQRRKRIAELLESLGISVSQFDTEAEHEDKDVLQAIILAIKGEEIPEDLRQRLLNKKELEQQIEDYDR